MKVRTELRLYLVIFFVLCPDILWAEYVPVETARQVAVNSLNKSIQAKALQRRQKESPGVEVEQRAVPKMTEEQITDIFPATENDILVYYVFNFSPQGWAIISADDAAYPVIGYCESGFYDPNVLNQPPALTAWMDNVAAEIANAVARGLQGLPDTVQAWKQLSVAPDNFLPDLGDPATAQSVGPLIQSTWGQGINQDGWPWGNNSYNKYCPWEYTDWTHLYRNYCPTGCTATAMAQIMKYWKWPPVGYGSHGYNTTYVCSHECSGFGWREVDFSQQYYDWSDSSMPLNTYSNAIAILMRDIGVAVEMDYTPSGSGAWPGNAFQDYFRYNAGPRENKAMNLIWIGKLKAELNAGRPIWYAGENASGSSAHAFVCDGYDSSGSFHFNWGWDGSYDGYFTVDDLTPGSHDYSYSQSAIFGIQPNMPLEVYVDDNYSAGGFNDGHKWFIDAFNSIQLAILIVRPGGTVSVAAGTYNEAIDFKGKAIHLYSIGGPDVTTINGFGHYHVVQCIGSEGPDTILDGFTITGGIANGSTDLDKCGGGMFNYYSSPTVTNCRFISNVASLHGGGMHNEYCSPNVTNCSFIVNASAAHGGGMMNNVDSLPTVVNCSFSLNTAGSSGGGMANSFYCNPTVTNCTFSGNSAKGFGGGMYNYYSSPTVTNCRFSDNKVTSAGSGGGGICNNEQSSPTVTNCNFTNNGGAFYGGGMFNYVSSSPNVTNCNFSGNSAQEGGGGMCNITSEPTVTNCTFRGNSAVRFGGGMFNGNSDPTVTNCIFWDDTPFEMYNPSSSPIVTYSDVKGCTGLPWFGTGCIDADPCFVDMSAGNLRLRPESLCIDAGDNSAPNLQPTDLDGHPRIIDGDCNNIGVIDMGAYEFDLAYFGDFDDNCSVDFFDFSILAQAWMTQEGEPGWDWVCDISDPPDNYIDWRDLVVIAENWLATP
jgi:hypothetical protein